MEPEEQEGGAFFEGLAYRANLPPGELREQLFQEASREARIPPAGDQSDDERPTQEASKGLAPGQEQGADEGCNHNGRES